jgi:hypothetical protein
VVVPVVAAALGLVAIAGAVLMVTASSGNASQSAAVGPPARPIKDPLMPPKSERVRVYDGPPFHVSYVTTPVFKERALRLKSSSAASEGRPACVDGLDFAASPCVWPASPDTIESSGVDWPRVGLGVTLFGGVGLMLLASAWLWSRRRSHHPAMP